MSDQLNISFNNTAYPTNVTSVLGPAGHIALNVVLILVFIVPALVFNILLIAAIILDKSNLAATRIALVNSIVGSTVTILTTFFYDFPLIARIAGTLDRGTDDSLGRFCYYLLLCSGLLRSVAVAIYSVVVFLIIKKGSKKVKAWPVAVATVAVWIIIVIIAFPTVFEFIIRDTHFVDKYVLQIGITTAGYIYIYLLITIVEVPAKVLSISLLVAILMYIKRNTITDGKRTKKAMVKFLFWFTIINIFTTLLNVFIPLLGAQNYTDPTIALVNALFKNIFGHIFFAGMSVLFGVLLLCQFAKIRKSFIRVATCACLTKGNTILSNSSVQAQSRATLTKSTQ